MTTLAKIEERVSKLERGHSRVDLEATAQELAAVPHWRSELIATFQGWCAKERLGADDILKAQLDHLAIRIAEIRGEPHDPLKWRRARRDEWSHELEWYLA